MSLRLLALAAVTLLLGACQSTPTKNSTVPANQDMIQTADTPTYSNEAFRELVSRYANEDGLVDYGAWQAAEADMALLDQQVSMIAVISPDSHPGQFGSRADVRSYWINTYNTLVVDAVLEYWPLESVRDVKISISSRVVPGKGFFYDRPVVVGGTETNLYDLEKKMLKSQKDPRLHFALNCASSSCPVLRPWDWTDQQLDQATRDFVNNPDNVRVDDGVVYLNRIFKWYRRDFPEDTYSYLGDYAEPPLRDDLQRASQQGYRTEFLEYDWDLNDARH